MAQALSLAYSPCPNDTYIFAAWTRGMLTDAPVVQVVLDDVEALNRAARIGTYELTKVSYGAIPYLLDRYRILRSGGALGRGCGPLVVAAPQEDGTARTLASFAGKRIAIPGALTTAYVLLRLALPSGFTPVEMRFDRIVRAVADGTVDAGLIIHESRFTYETAGLACVDDLGAWWENETGSPIPLGAILARRDLSPERTRAIDATIAKSLTFAREHDAQVSPYVREHAFEMEESVMRAHIALYVNAFSEDVGPSGEAAVREFFSRAAAGGILPHGVVPEFTS